MAGLDCEDRGGFGGKAKAVKLRIAEAADAEAFDAAIWYESRRSGLGNEFLEEYKTALAEIRSDPMRLPLLETDLSTERFRRFLFHRFP